MKLTAGNKKRYAVTLETWKPLHSKILKFRVNGTPTREIARIVNLTVAMVNYITSSPYFQERLLACRGLEDGATSDERKEVLEDARVILRKNVIPAVLKLNHIMHFGEAKDRIQLDAAQAILDRAGLPKATVVENVSRNYTPEEIESAKNTLLEIESITARVSTTQSRFLMRQSEDPTPEPTAKDQDAIGEFLPTSNNRP